MKLLSKKSNLPYSVLGRSIGCIYFWFGILKLFHNYSPAEKIATDTIRVLTFGLLQADVSIVLLGILECTIGICFLLHFRMKTALELMFTHLFFTFSPFIIFPALMFSHIPFCFTFFGAIYYEEYSDCWCGDGSLAISCC